MMSQVLKAGFLYFSTVFGVGFILGTIRVLWVVPRLGERSAELLEMPIMCLVTIVAARWVARRTVTPTPLRLLSVGLVALSMLLAAELVMVVLVRRVTLREYLTGRDPVSGAAFIFALGLFAIMPVILGRSSYPLHKGAR
jgi:Na+-transporting methylmalonyl-CoA/oxaloacetate decarboxylase beta subunit